jgi:hypothetical protein
MSADVVADVSTAVVSFRSADGDEVSSKLEPSMPALFDAQPWRTFRSYKGQRNYSGWYWSATERAHVIHESRNELATLLLADFDVGVHRIAAQPFHLTANVNGKIREHTLDYLLATDDGTVVIDVTTEERLSGPKVAFLCAWTRQVIESIGWRYDVITEQPRVLLANVRFLAGYRRDWLVNEAALSEVRSRASTLVGCRIDDAERHVADIPQPLVRSALMHMLWLHEFPVDLSVPLSPTTLLEMPK